MVKLAGLSMRLKKSVDQPQQQYLYLQKAINLTITILNQQVLSIMQLALALQTLLKFMDIISAEMKFMHRITMVVQDSMLTITLLSTYKNRAQNSLILLATIGYLYSIVMKSWSIRDQSILFGTYQEMWEASLICSNFLRNLYLLFIPQCSTLESTHT